MKFNGAFAFKINKTIEKTYNIKYLEVIIDSELNDNFEYMCRKIVYFERNCRKVCIMTAINIFNDIIKPHF